MKTVAALITLGVLSISLQTKAMHSYQVGVINRIKNSDMQKLSANALKYESIMSGAYYYSESDYTWQGFYTTNRLQEGDNYRREKIERVLEGNAITLFNRERKGAYNPQNIKAEMTVYYCGVEATARLEELGQEQSQYKLFKKHILRDYQNVCWAQFEIYEDDKAIYPDAVVPILVFTVTPEKFLVGIETIAIHT